MVRPRFSVRSLLLLVLVSALLLGLESSWTRWQERSARYRKQAHALITSALRLRDRAVGVERRAGENQNEEAWVARARINSLTREAIELELKAEKYRNAADRPWQSSDLDASLSSSRPSRR